MPYSAENTGVSGAMASGLLRVVGNDELRARDDEEREKAAQAAQQQPVIEGLAKHVFDCWTAARDARNTRSSADNMSVEDRLLASLRAKLGAYDPAKLTEIKKFGGSDIYARLIATKARTASAWIKDVLLNANDRPWVLEHSPIPEEPVDLRGKISALVQTEAQEIAATTGMPPDPQEMQQRVSGLREQALQATIKRAGTAMDKMQRRIEDQMAEGGFAAAMAAFVDDLVIFPLAVMKCPVVRRKKMLSWLNGQAQLADALVYEWERVSPFDIYPAPFVTTLDDGYVVQRHRLSRRDVQELRGVEGYDDEAVASVLGRWDGLGNWLTVTSDTQREELELKDMQSKAPESLVDALEFHGDVPGSLLIEWGLPDNEVEDPLADYPACVWLVGGVVIKAQVNYDPRGKKPYYVTSYELVPGSFWGNSLTDILSDMQDACNAALRSLINNAAIASGPQVAMVSDRIPPDEPLTQMFPWKIWQFLSDPTGSSAKPIEFFQPSMNVAELLGMFEKFYQMADDLSAIPRYMQGSEKVGGAGRTASGLSMLLDAANKTMKQVLSNIDIHILAPMIDTMFVYNMLNDPDPDIKGDVRAVARGVLGLGQKDALQLRRNEFLAATANPFDLQIIGLPGRASILRETAKALDMPVDDIVPDPEVMKQQQEMQQMAAAAQAAGAGGMRAPQGGEQLMNGAPVADNFSPSPMRAGGNGRMPRP